MTGQLTDLSALNEILTTIEASNPKEFLNEEFDGKTLIETLLNPTFKVLNQPVISETNSLIIKRVFKSIELVFDNSPHLINSQNDKGELLYKWCISGLISCLCLDQPELVFNLKECLISIINSVTTKSFSYKYTREIGDFVLGIFDRDLSVIFKHVNVLQSDINTKKLLIQNVHLFTIFNDYDLCQKMKLDFDSHYKFQSYCRKLWYLLNLLDIDSHSRTIDQLKSILLINLSDNLVNDEALNVKNLEFLLIWCHELIADPYIHKFEMLIQSLSLVLLKLYIKCIEMKITENFLSFIDVSYLLTSLKLPSTLSEMLLIIKYHRDPESLDDESLTIINTPFVDLTLENMRISFIEEFGDESVNMKIRRLLSFIVEDPRFAYVSSNEGNFDLKDWFRYLASFVQTIDLPSNKPTSYSIITSIGNFACILSEEYDFINSISKICDAPPTSKNFNSNISIHRPKVEEHQVMTDCLDLLIQKFILNPRFKEESLLHVNILLTLYKIFACFRPPDISMNCKIFNFLGECLRSTTRVVRILTSRILPLYLISDPDEANQNNLQNIIFLLDSINFKKELYLAEATIRSWCELGHVSEGERLGVILTKLINFIGSSNSYHSSLAFHEIRVIAENRSKTPWKLLSPFMPDISYVIARAIDIKPTFVQRMTQLLDVSIATLLLRTERYTVPLLLTHYKYDVIQDIAEYDQTDKVNIVHRNLPAIIAQFLCENSEINENKIIAILSNASPLFSDKKLSELVIQAYPIQIAWNILKHYRPELDEHTNSIKSALIYIAGVQDYFDQDEPSSRRKMNADESIVKSFFEKTILGIIQFFSEAIHDTRGSQPYKEKAKSLYAIDYLIRLCPSATVFALAQITTCLQVTIENKDLEALALRCWKTLINSLEEDHLIAIYDLSISIILQRWDSFGYIAKLEAKSILRDLLGFSIFKKKYSNYLFSVTFHKELNNIFADRVEFPKSRRESYSLLFWITTRLRGDNKFVVKQALTDLNNYLSRYQVNFHERQVDVAAYNTAIPVLIGTLLDSSYKYRIADDEISTECASCLSLIGSLDSNKFELRPKDAQRVILSNFSNHRESLIFLVEFIEDVVIKAFWASSDPVKQLFLAYSMQEFLKLLNFDKSTINGRPSDPIPKAWERFSDISRSTLTPLLSAKYNVTMTPYVPQNYPIFRHITKHPKWLRALTTDLLKKSATLNCPGSFMFKVCSSIAKDQDLEICNFILPYAALNIMVCGEKSDIENVKLEINTVLHTETSGLHPSDIESIRSCYQTIFTILDYFKKWCSSVVKWKGRKNQTHQRLDGYAFSIQEFLNSIPQPLLAKRSSECDSHERAILNLEQCYRDNKVDEDNMIDDLKFVPTIQAMYANLDDVDALGGILKKFSTQSLDDKLLEIQYSENWFMAQESFEVLSTQNNEVLKTESNTKLLRTLYDHEMYEDVLNNLDSKVNLENNSNIPKEWISIGLRASALSGNLENLKKWIFITDSTPQFLEKETEINYHISKSLISLHEGNREVFKENLSRAYQLLGSSLLSAKDTSLSKNKMLFNQLHALHDIDEISGFNNIPQSQVQETLRVRLNSMTDDFHSQYYMLTVHKAVKLLKDETSGPELSDIWVQCAKIARKHARLDLATKAVINAVIRNDDDKISANLEYSNLLWDQGEQTRAIKAVDDLRRNPLIKKASERSEIQLLYARWLDSSNNGSSATIIKAYMDAIELHKVWDEPYYHLGTYYGKIMGTRLASSDLNLQGWDGAAETYLIRFYSRALKTGPKYVLEVLPKIITTWLDFGESMDKFTTTKGNERIHFERLNNFKTILAEIENNIKYFPSYFWYTTFSQVLSRITHKDVTSADLLQQIATKVTKDYSSHALWSILAQRQSKSKERKKIADEIFLNAVQGTSESSAKNLFASLLSLTMSDIPGNKRACSLSKDFPSVNLPDSCKYLVIPTKSNFKITLPSTPSAMKHHSPFPKSSEETFGKFEDEIAILTSMQKPRKVTVLGSTGQFHSILLKPKDDLRKDAKLMELTTYIDHLLKQDYESENRKLGILTYAVVPLTEEYGIIEWVDGSRTMRDIVSERQKKVDFRQVKTLLDVPDLDSKVRNFEKLTKAFPPVLYSWFLEQYPDPSSWYAARNSYTRSTAVMSIVGYLLGLGDRHGENLLFQESDGSILHVDFDCLFEKGASLNVPETVPFRLTENMTDAMGIAGVEGTFRKSCEVTTRLIRHNEPSLMNILQGFIYDPILEWSGTSKSRRNAHNDPELVLTTIRRKIRGILGKEGIPLSVQAQVEAVIQQATSIENLASMYHGWMAYW